MSKRFAALALVLASALAPLPAFAQGADNIPVARELAKNGYDALDKKNWAAAADFFARADALYQAPTISLGLGLAYKGLGKVMSAYEAFSKAAHWTVPANASEAFVKAVADAKVEMETISTKVPGIVINVKGPADAKITLDGANVPAAALGIKRPVDPGAHVVKVTAPGHFPGEAKVSVTEGKVETVTIAIKPDPNYVPPPPDKGPGSKQPEGPAAPVEPPSKLQKTLGFVGIGVGAAGLVLGGAMGGVALAKHSDLAKDCPNGVCPGGQRATLESKISSYNTMGTISTVGFIAGGALAVTGVVVLLTAPKAQKTTTGIVPVIGPGYLGATGRF